MLFVSKLFLLAFSINVISSRADMELPCDQVSQNHQMCSQERFRTKCQKECTGNNGNNNDGNNGNSANKLTTSKPTNGNDHHGSSEETHVDHKTKAARRSGKKFTSKSVTGSTKTMQMNHDNENHNHQVTKLSTTKPVSSRMVNSNHEQGKSQENHQNNDNHDHPFTKVTTKPISSRLINSNHNEERDQESHQNDNNHDHPFTKVTTKPVSSRMVNSNHESHGSHENNNNNDHHDDHQSTKHVTHIFSKSTTKHPSNTGGAQRSASATTHCDKITPCVKKETADEGFRSRCKAAGIPDTCLDKCRYDVTFEEMKKAMLGKQCPMDKMRDFLICGSKNQDNRACCQQAGLLDGKKAFCHPFCNPSGNEWPTSNPVKYLPCASEMAGMMQCHWAGLTE
jgi:hypothetical protein